MLLKGLSWLCYNGQFQWRDHKYDFSRSRTLEWRRTALIFPNFFYMQPCQWIFKNLCIQTTFVWSRYRAKTIILTKISDCKMLHSFKRPFYTGIAALCLVTGRHINLENGIDWDVKDISSVRWVHLMHLSVPQVLASATTGHTYWLVRCSRSLSIFLYFIKLSQRLCTWLMKHSIAGSLYSPLENKIQLLWSIRNDTHQ